MHVYKEGEIENLIGSPISNTAIFILDEEFQSAEIGREGELFIEGIGCARGYLNNPVLTKERFLETEVGGRTRKLYRTGDRVRLLPDGNMQFLGRIDEQVKINGYRIELTEVEKNISDLEWVSDVAVVVRSQRNDLKQMCVFYIAKPNAKNRLNEDESLSERIKRHLLDRLPAYMIPSIFIEVASFPLTLQGKVDKKELCRRAEFSHKSNQATLAKIDVTSIWRDVLGMNELPTNVSFFDLGGTSILLYVLKERVDSFYKTTFDISNFFEYPTIDDFTKYLRSRSEDNADSVLNKKINRIKALNASRQQS